MRNKYNLNCSNMMIDETYTEIWTKILNCYYISYIVNTQEKKFSQYSFFYFLLLIEKKFSLIQASKILNYLKKGGNKNINKHTNVAAYYLLTSEVLQNLNDFLKSRFKNKNVFYLKNNNVFIKFLFNLPKIPTIPIKDYKNLKSFKTFRMTASEIDISY